MFGRLGTAGAKGKPAQRLLLFLGQNPTGPRRKRVQRAPRWLRRQSPMRLNKKGGSLVALLSDVLTRRPDLFFEKKNEQPF